MALVTTFVTASQYQCSIEQREWREIQSFTKENFPLMPVVYQRDDTDRVELEQLRRISDRDFLLSNYATTPVTVSSSNTFSQGLFHMQFDEYVHHMSERDQLRDKANESYYFFGNNYAGIWSTMSDLYVNPPCHYCDKAGAKTLGIGGKSSGVSFHFHGMGFSEVIIGRKRWYLFPPSLSPLLSHFSPNCTAEQIILDITTMRTAPEAQVYVDVDSTSHVQALHPLASNNPLIDNNAHTTAEGGSSSSSSLPPYFHTHPESLQQLRDGLVACDIGPGDVLYFPPMWMHATTNLDAYNVFFSLFLDPVLMRGD